MIDWNTVDYSNSKTTSTANAAVATTLATSVKAAAAVATSSATTKTTASTTTSSGSSLESAVESAVAELLNGIIGVANELTEFGTATEESNCPGIMCINNVGSPYGSNMIKVDSIGDYSYTNTFTNTQDSTITVNVWNKAGYDMQANSGQSLAPTHTTLTFTLAPGASQIVAFMENTSGGFCEATTKTQSYGAFDTTWGEWSFIDGGSAYDVSAIENSAGNTYNMTMYSEEAACTSDMTKNMWITDVLAVGTDGTAEYDSSGAATGGDCVALGTSMHIVTTLGGTVA